MAMNQFLLGNGALLLTSFIWGSAFVAQVTGMDLIGPFSFSASRYFLSTLFVFMLILFQKEKDTTKLKDLLLGGAACGIFLFLGSSCQQVGLLYTTAGKTSFITSLYIVLVPILGIFFKKKVNLFTWMAVFLGTVGLYLLAMSGLTEGAAINKGDLFVFLGSFFWAGHILIIDHFTKKVNPIKLSCLQFAVTTCLAAIVALSIEAPTLPNIFASWKSIAYAGILSGGIAYTLQIVGQKHTTNATLASLILSLESVFGAIAGFVVLHERLKASEILGCVIMFIAILVAQIPSDFFEKKKGK
ncbi:DMT family transporter [Fusobacterium necrophorum]|nr:DMT family transporter [Fusobacterium necrophorum]MDK4486419.1 DMT family transporter [Fusobacterium necrophorum]MDK4488807.1 DMT family transporter [Fusobacterium necrophorum]MDK4504951.1 DMT family transporter [Fusobacterium necrophorum]